jgi:hypothetical protein
MADFYIKDKFFAQILSIFITTNNIIDQYDAAISLENKRKCKNN